MDSLWRIRISTITDNIGARLNLLRPGQKVTLKSQLQRQLRRKTVRRRIFRAGFLTLNAAILLTISFFVLHARSGGADSAPGVLTNSAANPQTAGAANPLDQISSADIALTVTRMTNLTESTSVANLAVSQDSTLTTAPSTESVIVKPEVVATAFKSNKDIQTYTVQPGDTVSSIASKFNVTSDSIKWSNNLSTDSVNTGVKLLIPPVGYSGIVYTVKAGDTIDSLATKYKADKNELIAANDAEISGIKVGERIIIPNGQMPAPVTYASAYSGYGFAWGSTAIYGSNGYDFGWCTWYVANRRAQLGRPVPSNLGDARTWYTIASRNGLATGTTPQNGAVLVNQPGDHVAVVEQVNPDGSIWISEMNSYGQRSIADSTPYGGWDRIDYKLLPADVAARYYYIY